MAKDKNAIDRAVYEKVRDIMLFELSDSDYEIYMNTLNAIIHYAASMRQDAYDQYLYERIVK